MTSNSEQPKKPGVGQIFLEELNNRFKPPEKEKKRGRVGQTIAIPLLAVFTGLIIGGIFIILTTEQVYVAFGQSFGAGLAAAWEAVSKAYSGLFYGCLWRPGPHDRCPAIG